MPYDITSHLWPDSNEHFFSDRVFVPQLQKGPHCVSTSLAILTGTEPERFQGTINTQNPSTWSDALQPYGMKLAYCPTDARKLRFYMPELIRLDDLFTLSYYTVYDPEEILMNPNERGWVCGSHIVVLHRYNILDPMSGVPTPASQHGCLEYHTKRILGLFLKIIPEGYKFSRCYPCKEGFSLCIGSLWHSIPCELNHGTGKHVSVINNVNCAQQVQFSLMIS